LRPRISIMVSLRNRKASPFQTTTAEEPGPVATRSPRLTGVPLRATLPLTVTEPSARCTPVVVGLSPEASASRMAPCRPAAPSAPPASRFNSSRRFDGSRISAPCEDDVPDAMAELQAAPLELGFRARGGPRREIVRGVAQARRGREHLQ